MPKTEGISFPFVFFILIEVVCGLDSAVIVNDTLGTHVGLPLCSKSDRAVMRTTTAAALISLFFLHAHSTDCKPT